VISFWVRAGFTLVDRFYAAGLEAPDASQAAIGLTMPFEFLMIACWVGTSNGVTARLAAAMGAGEGRKVQQVLRATRAVVHALVAGFLVLAAAIWLLTPRMAEPLGLEADVAGQFRIYATVLLAGSAFTSFWSILPDSIVKAHQDTRSTMWAGLLSGATNIVLNTVFVFVFHWGILGIALSTVLGRLAGLAYARHRAAVHERARIASGRDTAPGTFDRPLRAILALSLPASITYVVMALESLAINGIVANTPDSTETLAAWSLFDGIARFLYMPPIAVGVALLPLTAHLWGERDCARIRRELTTALRACAIYAVLFVLPLSFVLGDPLARVLTDSEVAGAYTAMGMRLLAPTVLAVAPLFIYRSCFEGMAQPRPGLVISLIRAAVLVVPLSWAGSLLAPSYGEPPIAGIYAGYVVGSALATAGMALWVRRHLAREVARPAPV
jgi:Na+-driven multidrug efflux pump